MKGENGFVITMTMNDIRTRLDIKMRQDNDNREMND